MILAMRFSLPRLKKFMLRNIQTAQMLTLLSLLRVYLKNRVKPVWILSTKTLQSTNENARIALDQAKYERNYSKLLKKFDEAEARLATVKEKIALRQGKQEQVEMFLKELENTDLVDEFDESLFNRLVEVIDIEKEKITVTFKDGSEVTI